MDDINLEAAFSKPQSGVDPMHLENLLALFNQITLNFERDLAERPVAVTNTQLPLQSLPAESLSAEEALAYFCDQVLPQMSGSKGPRYWGFVTGGATPVATFADWLVTTLDQNVAKGGDSIATEIERQTIRWLCQLFDLGDEFDGIISTGATASNFLAAVCARQFIGEQQGLDCAREGIRNLDYEVFATTPHASMLKSLAMAGMGREQWVKVAALDNSEAMDVRALAACLHGSNAQGKVIIASAATVTTTDFDDLKAIAQLAKQHNAWLHVDAAFGAFERLIPERNWLSHGLELADSITLDSHKWLNVPYDSGVFLTRHPKIWEAAFDVPAPYLANEGPEPDFMSLGVENSRRFRALPVWMSLLVYGKQGIGEWVNRNVECAKILAGRLDASTQFELVHPCKLNVVLFRPAAKSLSADEADARTRSLLKAVNKAGIVFLSPGQWQGKAIIRAAFSNWSTRKVDVDMALDNLHQMIEAIDRD